MEVGTGAKKGDSAGPGGEVCLLLDRSSALDIAAFVVAGVDLSPGDAVPSDGDPRIDRALAGFFFTCGPDHIRHPEPFPGRGDGARYPLHGSLCGTPVTRTDMASAGNRCTAVIEVELACGGRAAIERCWRAERDGGGVLLEDRVVNIGATAFAPMMMYHMNIAGRLLGAETLIESTSVEGGSLAWRFGAEESAHFCLPAVAGGDGWAEVSLVALPGLAGRSLHVRFRAETLPFLQIWRCQRGSADVISIEPASHRLAKRAELAAGGELALLEPGERRDYALAFAVS
ncbi:DUF4432 family protein [Sinorhizobium alkalisoli]|uniref:DUF4432 domain-containing protein n=1 Tax=Sinorhizobium alkalisoli TaxID=1752398 RepID=A0A1E3V3L5_9HYPH|nr:DUF4432 family protein [Sinorhizobium alkalisoli]MCA1490962.1 DUF4432 family protein [Ensifer sp. NBAIM29]MCG5482424.1 DUF4432 family protein [Sinorhizobium meliloti]ODR88193.1 DUF4432 domain-containing protein [Sinorhizobium alkalisoli]QFI67082.1 hypothetical protein EKH55_2208 [Sinorhizobium alkalisoli]